MGEGLEAYNQWIASAADQASQLNEAYHEGYQASCFSVPLAANPFMRGTDEFDEWRSGWADADYAIWSNIMHEHRKASTE